MKTKFTCILSFFILVFNGKAQEKDSTRSWDISADLNTYIFSDNVFLLPVVRADKGALHLEARYNYEDLNTFSAWAGYNISGGKKWEYTFTPMLGGVIGNSNGLAPGLEFTIAHKNFELYSESEYLFEFSDKTNNFFYNWTDLTYAPNDWLWFGLSGQRTRLYKTDLEIQRGFLLGGGFKNWEFTGYLYNLFFDEPFVIFTLSFSY
ncbi:MAG: hypothetical protein JNK73_14050 [Bacteroidia bacterium]|nr:hypothetical protein [Bacteroidia bacterium]